jgi:hypothetical protein
MSKTPEELMQNLVTWNIDYGFWDYDKQEKVKYNQDFNITNAKNYKLMETDDVIKHRIAICWDIVELARKWFNTFAFDDIYSFAAYYLEQRDSPHQTHTFCTFLRGNKPYLFEYTMSEHRGVEEFTDIKKLLRVSKQRFKDRLIERGVLTDEEDNQGLDNIRIYRMGCTPSPGIDAETYMDMMRLYGRRERV